jgi:hypothetical protein
MAEHDACFNLADGSTEKANLSITIGVFIRPFGELGRRRVVTQSDSASSDYEAEHHFG